MALHGRFVLLALCLGAAPSAWAFPPCPVAPLELMPLADMDAGNGARPKDYIGYYTLVGDAGALEQVASTEPSSPSTGKCGDRIPVPQRNVADGEIGLAPVYAPKAAFGAVLLPDVRPATPSDLDQDYVDVTFAYQVAIDTRPLPTTDDWFDIAQLEFRDSTGEDGFAIPPVNTSVFRLRKHQAQKGQAAVVELIWVGTSPSTGLVTQRTIATVPITDKTMSMPLTLAWRMTTGTHGLDSTVSLYSATGRRLTQATLPGQFAYTLSSGLLNYNAVAPESYVTSDVAVDLSETTLSVTAK